MKDELIKNKRKLYSIRSEAVLNKINILPAEINSSWNDFLDNEILNMLYNIEKRIGSNYTPDTDKVMRFMRNDLSDMKVVILGQDPYPEKGRATGRAFEVGDLASWQDKFKQVSLKNIVRLIYKTYKNIDNYDEIKSYSEIKKEINAGLFNILPPNKIFESWEKQGVLLLNAYLTCEIGNPGSHRVIWAEFADSLIRYIVKKNNSLIWFLWGKDANVFRKYIIKGQIYSCRHPMMCSVEFEDDFLKSNCFKDTKDIINWIGQ